jgi:branched-subunit amino acid transport protein
VAQRRRPSLETSQLAIWSLIVVVGAINFAARLSFIALFARREMPPLLARALRHVPAAMLTAIVVPAIVFAAPGVIRLDVGNVKLTAALVAGVVAWRWRNTLLTIGVGMAALWLLQRFVG